MMKLERFAYAELVLCAFGSHPPASYPAGLLTHMLCTISRPLPSSLSLAIHVPLRDGHPRLQGQSVIRYLQDKR